VHVKTPGIISINHVMWQPIFECIGSCTGCYVKKSPSARYTGPIKTEVLDLIKEGKLKCDQLTISLDSFRKPAPAKVKEFTDILKHLLATWSTHDPELGFAVHDVNALTQWIYAMNMKLSEVLKKITILQISSFPALGKDCDELRAACKSADTILIYNKTIKPTTATSKKFAMACRYADKVHLVLHKSVLGERQSRSAISNWARAIKASPADKLELDQCMTSSRKWIENAYSCSAGIDRVHIWPDGFATACPYDSNRCYLNDTDCEVNTWESLEMIETINTVPMLHCDIWHALKELKKVSKDSCTSQASQLT